VRAEDAQAAPAALARGSLRTNRRCRGATSPPIPRASPRLPRFIRASQCPTSSQVLSQATQAVCGNSGKGRDQNAMTIIKSVTRSRASITDRLEWRSRKPSTPCALKRSSHLVTSSVLC